MNTTPASETERPGTRLYKEVYHPGPQPTWFHTFIMGKTRIYFGWLVMMAFGFAAREYPTWPGILVCGLGAAFRVWSSGYLRKNDRLAIGGPYALTRNPLYFGTYVMAVGASLSLENIPLVVFVTVLFGVVYHLTIVEEETKLKVLFGPAYLRYLASVNRFFPSLPPAEKTRLEINAYREDWSFSWEVAKTNRAWDPLTAWVGFIGYLSLCAWLWKNWG